MARSYKYFLVFFIVCFSCSPAAFSQDISGTWEGNFIDGYLALQPQKLVVEINVYRDSLLSGVSHLYYSNNRYEHYKIKGIYRKKQNLIIIVETSTIAVDLGPMGNCLGTYITKLGTMDSKMLLQGWWRTNERTCASPDSRIWLKKDLPPSPPPRPVATKKNIVVPKTKDIKKTAESPATLPSTPVKVVPVPAIIPRTIQSPAAVITPAKILNRQTDVQSLLEIPLADKDSIKVQVYDNGTIDGDSVSVFVDKTERISRKRISEKPLTFYVSLSKDLNPISNIRLVAESMGSIPPCTALMIITTRTKRYEVNLSSNFNKNAAVELFLKNE